MLPFVVESVEQLRMLQGNFTTINNEINTRLVLEGDMSNQDLSGIDFRGSYFSERFILNGTDLSGANLNNVKYFGSRENILALIGTNFTNAAMIGFSFFEKDLVNVNFTGANLRSASFFLTYLTGVNFTNADLTGANFKDSVFDNIKLYGANLNAILPIETKKTLMSLKKSQIMSTFVGTDSLNKDIYETIQNFMFGTPKSKKKKLKRKKSNR